MCLCECMPGVYRYLQRPKDGVRSLGTGVTDGRELPDVASGNWAWILCKGPKHFIFPTQLSIHFKYPLHFLGFFLGAQL